MDRQIEATKTPVKPDPSSTSRHLMCRAALWGIAGFLGCGYFAWISFSHITRGEYDWPHDAWTAATYIVWIILLTGLVFDTRCLRERLFFGVLVVNFVIGCALTLWSTIPAADVRMARIGTGALWALAALLSLTTIRKVDAES
ncbi:MAG: hypothetical protein LAO56_23455 [Acidobacteriia bacterium]|nr:hypothetical protein [Terriglobia bacterium]